MRGGRRDSRRGGRQSELPEGNQRKRRHDHMSLWYKEGRYIYI